MKTITAHAGQVFTEVSATVDRSAETNGRSGNDGSHRSVRERVESESATGDVWVGGLVKRFEFPELRMRRVARGVVNGGGSDIAVLVSLLGRILLH